jgi:hypothetical protein
MDRDGRVDCRGTKDFTLTSSSTIVVYYDVATHEAGNLFMLLLIVRYPKARVSDSNFYVSHSKMHRQKNHSQPKIKKQTRFYHFEKEKRRCPIPNPKTCIPPNQTSKKVKRGRRRNIHIKPQKAASPLPVPPSKHCRSTRVPKKNSQPRKHSHHNPHQNHEAKRSNHTPSIGTSSLPHIRSRWSMIK